MRIVIKTDNAAQLGKQLTQLHRSAFPSAVRNTLNDVAFEAKKQIPNEAARNFTTRQKNLFKKSIGVEKATGFNVNSMKSKVGIIKSFPISEGLEKQETGGNLKTGKLVPHNMSRISGKNNKKVKSQNYLQGLNIHDSSSAYAYGNKSKKSRMIAAVISANKVGSRYMLIKRGKAGTVYEVSGASQSRTSRRFGFKLTPLYVYKDDNFSKIDSKPFIKPASIKASRIASDRFKNNAEFQINKYLRR